MGRRASGDCPHTVSIPRRGSYDGPSILTDSTKGVGEIHLHSHKKGVSVVCDKK